MGKRLADIYWFGTAALIVVGMPFDRNGPLLWLVIVPLASFLFGLGGLATILDRTSSAKQRRWGWGAFAIFGPLGLVWIHSIVTGWSGEVIVAPYRLATWLQTAF